MATYTVKVWENPREYLIRAKSEREAKRKTSDMIYYNNPGIIIKMKVTKESESNGYYI